MNGAPRWLDPDLNNRAQLLVIEPLFEEANRCRRMIAEILRKVDAGGLTATFAQLPGTGESLVEIADVRLRDWLGAIGRAPQPLIASFRGGALLDAAGPSRPVWRFAPETGARVVRDLRRTVLTGERSGLLAGHRLSGTFTAELEALTPVALTNLRTVELDRAVADADLKVTGAPLWRRAEPGEDAGLSAALAADLLAWSKSCAAS